MALEKATGLVIHTMNYGENDRIITLFTKEFGKITAMVKGARNPKSQFLGATQLFSYCDFVYYRGRSFAYLNQVTLIESFHRLRNDLNKLAKAAYITEAVYQAFEEGQEDDGVLRLMLNQLYFIHENMVRDDGIALLTFQLKLLGFMGFAPALSECGSCGSSKALVGLHRTDGTARCRSCVTLEHVESLDENGIDFLAQLQGMNLTQARQAELGDLSWMSLAEALNRLLENHIGRRIQSFGFLRNSV